MEIFTEYRNRYFLHTLQLLNAMAAGSRYTAQSLLDSFDACFPQVGENRQDYWIFDYIYGLLEEADDEKDNFGLLHFDKSGAAESLLPGPVPVRPLSIELGWLAGLLTDARLPLFLPAPLRQKLAAVLAPYAELAPQVPGGVESRAACDGGDDPAAPGFAERFRCLYAAMQSGSAICYTNQDAQGRRHENCQAVPFAISYSIPERRFRASLYSLDEDRPVKVNLARLQALSPSPVSVPLSREAMRAAIEKRQAAEPLRLEIRDDKNAVERCCALFSGFESQGECQPETETCVLTIRYYTFDEDEVVRSILSLGTAVRVIGGKAIQKRLQELFNAQVW